MTIALQFVAALLLIGAVIAVARLLSGGIEEALGEKPLRDRARDATEDPISRGRSS